MNKKSGSSKSSADKLVKTLRRKTRRLHATEEKIRIVLAGLRGEESIAELCLNLGDGPHQATRFLVSRFTSRPSLNLMPSMTFGN